MVVSILFRTEFGPSGKCTFHLYKNNHYKTVKSEVLDEGQRDQVYYHLPSINELLDADRMVYVTSEYVTIQHFPKKLTWVTTHWGKFFVNHIQPIFILQ